MVPEPEPEPAALKYHLEEGHMSFGTRKGGHAPPTVRIADDDAAAARRTERDAPTRDTEEHRHGT